MKQYNHILVVMEPKRDHQTALQRALELSHYNPKVKITVLRLVYDFSYDIHILNRLREKDTREDILRTHEEQLLSIIHKYTEHEEQTPNIDTKVVFAKDIAEGIIAEMKSGDYDLIIKAANHHGVLDAIIFTPIDWYLLRHADVPVIIAKDHKWAEEGSIVVAMDFSNRARMSTNLTLLREAQQVSAITGDPIHLVNSAPVALPTIMLEVPHYSPEIYAENILTEHRNRLYAFAKAHGIPEERCHIAEGMPDDVIPDLCRKVKARVVFIGSAGRTGAMAALMGNTCEEIVDYLDADLVVINKKVLAKQES
jgi:universal stress protein E